MHKINSKHHARWVTYVMMLLLSLTYHHALCMPAGNTLKGVVKDNSGAILQGVVISIPDLKVGTVTDSAGSYLIENLPAGKYLVQVKMISYSSVVSSVTIDKETIKNFTLTESAIEKSEVVVTGQSMATEIRRSPVPLVAINAQYLKENLSTNIIDAITNIPGITAVTTGPNVAKPFIRGLGYNRVLTVYDGMRQEGQQWGDEHGIEVDENSVERIEVIKGPASLIYGSDAMAGVVNLIPTQPAPVGKTIADLSTEYQSNNNSIGGSAMFSTNKNGFYMLARVSHKQAKNYQNSVDGRVYGTNYSETDGNASIGLNMTWGYSHLDFSTFDDQQAIPDGSRDSASRKFTKQITEADSVRAIVPDNELNTYSIPTLHQHIQHVRVFSTNCFNIGNSRLAVNIGYERSVRREFSHPEAGDIAGLYLQLNTAIYDVKYYFADIKGWYITTGINGMYQTNDVSAGTEFLIPSYKQFDIGPFLMARKSIHKLDISGGVRYDSRSFSNDALYTKTNASTGFDGVVSGTDTVGAARPFYAYSHTFSGVTGSVGMTYNFSKSFSAKANLARGFRAPNISEISSNGIHPGTASYQLGSTDLKPEFSLQEDIGFDFISPHVSASVSVFNNDITNYIFNQKLQNKQGQDSVIVVGFPTFRYQAGHAQLYGAEFSIDIHPHPLDWLHFENAISFVTGVNKGVNNDSAKYLPFIPPMHISSELRANFKKTSSYLRNTFVRFQLEYFAEQDHVYLAYGTETMTPAYALCNVSAGADVTDRMGKTICNISIFGNNLFDVAYQNHLSRLKYFEQYPNDPRGHSGIYNMGRNIGLKLAVPLMF
ncbi:MAG: TonB-dependent receptor [Bacteroidota bacterium]